MDLLDPRTLLLTITLLLAARAIVLAYVWRVLPDYAPAAYWTAGSVLVALGALLAGLREIAPTGISIVLAQSCIVPGGMLVDAGTMIAAGRRLPWRPALALLLALLPFLVWYTYGDPDYVARTVLTTLPAVLFDLYALVACWRKTSGRSATTLHILAIVLAVVVASNLFKLFGAISLQTTSLLQPGPPLIQFLLVSMVSFAVSTGLYVLLAAQWFQEQLDQELAVRKQAEAELKRHRDELEVLVRERTATLEERNAQLAQTQFAMDRVGIGVVWNEIDDGRFLYANSEACRQLGYTREELLERRIADINPDATPDTLEQLTRRLRDGDGRLRLETTHRRKDGSHYPVEITAYLHRNEGREWFIAFFNDIVARKAAEAELITAKEAAESASRAKSAFLGTMSHELRTPMNAILGMSYLARHDARDPHLIHRLDEIDIAAKGLLHIINSVLDIANIESNKLVLQSAAFSLHEPLEAVRDAMHEPLAGKPVELKIDAPPPLMELILSGDASRLTQILDCLVGNAIKFSERGTVELRIRDAGLTAESAYLLFEVEDQGIGISPDDQKRLFNAFEQADMSHTRHYGGTGLGLAISKHLAQLMGGDMGVRSQLGVGSCFWFTVRMERVEIGSVFR